MHNGRLFSSFNVMMLSSYVHVLATATCSSMLQGKSNPHPSRILELICMLHNTQNTTNLGQLAQILDFLDHRGNKFDRDCSKAPTRANWELKLLVINPRADQAHILGGLDPSSTINHEVCVLAGEEYVVYVVKGWDKNLICHGNDSVTLKGTTITQGILPLTIVNAYLEASEAELEKIDKVVSHIIEWS